jgi:hypothetical protein
LFHYAYNITIISESQCKNDYKFTRFLPPPKGSGFPPTTTERILFMKVEKKKVCGTCKHSKSEVPFGEFYCDNEESDCYGCECMYDDSCIDYEVEE